MVDLRRRKVALLLNYVFFHAKQMFGIDKMSPLLLRINLPQVFTICNIWALRKLAEDFQEDVVDGVIFLYNRSSVSL